METRKRTEAALGKIVDFKLQAAQPKTLAPQPGQASYIKYTPVQKGDAHNSGAQHRVIRMSEMPTDPLEPPRFRHKKVLAFLHQRQFTQVELFCHKTEGECPTGSARTRLASSAGSSFSTQKPLREGPTRLEDPSLHLQLVRNGIKAPRSHRSIRLV